MKIILLGAPGSGKGTLAAFLTDLGYEHLSTGDILRENIKNQTALGMQIKPIIDAGKLIPDEMINKIVKDKLEAIKDNYILDGYPRTINQAIALDSYADINKVIFLNASFKEVLTRLTSRRTCSNPKCKAIYNLATYDKQICEKCGSPIYQRDDDKADVISKRYDVYEKETSPLVDFYTKQNKLIEINVDGLVPEKVFDKVKDFIKEA